MISRQPPTGPVGVATCVTVSRTVSVIRTLSVCVLVVTRVIGPCIILPAMNPDEAEAIASRSVAKTFTIGLVNSTNTQVEKMANRSLSDNPNRTKRRRMCTENSLESIFLK